MRRSFVGMPTILQVFDFHSPAAWFDWLIAEAPRYALVCLTGENGPAVRIDDPRRNRRSHPAHVSVEGDPRQHAHSRQRHNHAAVAPAMGQVRVPGGEIGNELPSVARFSSLSSFTRTDAGPRIGKCMR